MSSRGQALELWGICGIWKFFLVASQLDAWAGFRGSQRDLPGGERGVVSSVPGLVDGALARARPGVLDASLTEKLRQCGVELMWCPWIGGNSFWVRKNPRQSFDCMPTWVSTLSSYSGPEAMSLRQMSGQWRLCHSPLASSYNRHETTMLSPGDRRQLGALLAPGRAGQNPTVPLQDRAGVLVHPLPPECPSGQHRCEGVCGRPPQARLPQCGWGFHQTLSVVMQRLAAIELALL